MKVLKVIIGLFVGLLLAVFIGIGVLVYPFAKEGPRRVMIASAKALKNNSIDCDVKVAAGTSGEDMKDAFGILAQWLPIDFSEDLGVSADLNVQAARNGDVGVDGTLSGSFLVTKLSVPVRFYQIPGDKGLDIYEYKSSSLEEGQGEWVYSQKPYQELEVTKEGDLDTLKIGLGLFWHLRQNAADIVCSDQVVEINGKPCQEIMVPVESDLLWLALSYMREAKYFQNEAAANVFEKMNAAFNAGEVDDLKLMLYVDQKSGELSAMKLDLTKLLKDVDVTYPEVLLMFAGNKLEGIEDAFGQAENLFGEDNKVLDKVFGSATSGVEVYLNRHDVIKEIELPEDAAAAKW